MNPDTLEELLNYLKEILDKNEFGDDEQKIKYLYDELEKIDENLPTMEKLEELQKIEVDLEIKYDCFNEFSYYFNPLWASIKKKIHDETVRKIREENKKKKVIE